MHRHAPAPHRTARRGARALRPARLCAPRVAPPTLAASPAVQEAIFRTAGFGARSALASVVVGAAKLAATLVGVALVDQLGRRPLLLLGTVRHAAARRDALRG